MKNQLNFDTIQESYLDSMISLAFMQMEALETQELIAKMESRESDEQKAEAEHIYALYLEKLRAEEEAAKKRRRMNAIKETARRVMNIAACIALIVVIALPIAVANVSAVRARVMQMLINMEPDNADVRMLLCEEQSFSVPEGWKGDYFPAYIPEGFEIYSVAPYGDKVKYKDAEGNKLRFDEKNETLVSGYDNENADAKYITVQGREAYVVQRDGKVTIIWAMDDRYFDVILDGSYEEALRIAESVRRITSD